MNPRLLILDMETGKLVHDPWWHRWFVHPIRNQLTQGMSIERVSWTVALGIVLGVFPIMGTTTLICVLAAWLLKLNQTLLHVFKSLMYPLHFALILVFIGAGNRLFGEPEIQFSVTEMVLQFKDDPKRFALDFGWAAFRGVIAWGIFAPPAIILLKIATKPVIRKISDRIGTVRESAV